jgi:hypothetical protein
LKTTDTFLPPIEPQPEPVELFSTYGKNNGKLPFDWWDSIFCLN